VCARRPLKSKIKYIIPGSIRRPRDRLLLLAAVSLEEIAATLLAS
jgi:hypothetical protein